MPLTSIELLASEHSLVTLVLDPRVDAAARLAIIVHAVVA